MESCRLLVRWNSRLHEWALYCSRLRSSSSALLGSARRVSGVRSNGYGVCSADALVLCAGEDFGAARARLRRGRGCGARAGRLRWGG